MSSSAGSKYLKRKWKQRLSKGCLRQPWQILLLSEWFRTESNRLSSTAKALCIAKEIENKYSEGDTCGALGNAYLGNFKRAIEFHRQALSIAKEIGAKDLEAPAHGNLGAVYNSRGDLERAIEFYQQVSFYRKRNWRRCCRRICILQPCLRKWGFFFKRKTNGKSAFGIEVRLTVFYGLQLQQS